MSASSPRCVQHLHSQPTAAHKRKVQETRHEYNRILFATDAESATPPVSPCISPRSPSSSSTSSLSTPDSSNRTSQGATAPWVPTLLSTKFYGPCQHHPTLRKNDQNLFCTTHAVKICQYCHHSTSDNPHQSDHSRCTVLHVSRYMYHDVLLAREANTLLDITHVQSYLNNGNRVVYMDRRAQPRSKLAPNAKACFVCDRTLQEPYRFCSVYCRLAFDKHPAAPPELPLPDGAPLPLSTVTRKEKGLAGLVIGGGARALLGELGSAVRSREREKRKLAAVDDGGLSTVKRHSGGNCDVLRGVGSVNRVSKKRRKGSPVRSLLAAHNGCVMTQ